MLRSQEKRKDRKTRKSRNKEKVVGFSIASLFQARKLGTVNQGETREIDHRTWRRPHGAEIIKAWEDMRDQGSIPDTFT